MGLGWGDKLYTSSGADDVVSYLRTNASWFAQRVRHILFELSRICSERHKRLLLGHVQHVRRVQNMSNMSVRHVRSQPAEKQVLAKLKWGMEYRYSLSLCHGRVCWVSSCSWTLLNYFQTLRGSLSGVSMQIIGSKYSFESS